MNEELLLRRAAVDDQLRIMEIIRQAQAQMCAQGSAQWQNGYPAATDIATDIEQGYGHVLCKPDKMVIAYGAVCFDGEPAYDKIEGRWLREAPCVVVHRLAVADGEKGHGVAAEFIRRTCALARDRGVGSFRVDTNFDNHYMLRLLEKLGFTFCGKVYYQSGERLAFEAGTDSLK